MIYLDHAATSPLRAEAWEAMHALLGAADYNPASAHAAGSRASEALEGARSQLAGLLQGERGSVVFTGGGTQADSLAVLGFARAHIDRSPRLLVSAIEHKAVLESARRGAREGAELVVLPVDSAGTVRLDVLKEHLIGGDDRPTLVSIMWANNEIGAVQPVAAACEIAHRHGALFHTDAVQAFGKIPVSLRDVPADLLTITAHKLGGPVGIGLLHADPDVTLEPLSYGGSQERALWPGTQNPLGARGFAEAARLAHAEREERAPAWSALREGLEDALHGAIADLIIHAGSAPERLPNLLSVGIAGCDQAGLLLALDLAGVAVSSGSACSSGAQIGSHVLEALGTVPEGVATLRFSFGPTTTGQDVERAAEATVRAVRRSRAAGGS